MLARIALLLVLLAAPVAANSIDKEVIRRPIQAATPRIARCYERQLVVTPGLEGTVVITFTIAVSGRVVESRGTGMDEAVASCVARVIRTLRFPRTPSEIRVSYPFTFHT